KQDNFIVGVGVELQHLPAITIQI
ncbi:hypothetical protein A2U01_0080742, partial [Trifolium medium]|nr:hypothetical protein [Trifolium medium]